MLNAGFAETFKKQQEKVSKYIYRDYERSHEDSKYDREAC